MPYDFDTVDAPTQSVMTAIGQAILDARRATQLSQAVVAERAGVSQSTISRLERGVAPGLRLASLAAAISGMGGERITIHR